MRKLTLIALFWPLLLCGLQAQSRVGIKAGLNTLRFDEAPLVIQNRGLPYTIRPMQNDLGVNLGLYALVRAKHFYVQPEALYSSWQTTFVLDSPGGSGEVSYVERYQNLDVPITFGFRFGIFRIGGGVVGHISLNSSSELLAAIPEYSQIFEPVLLGYQAGLGFDLWSITFDLRYEGNFDPFGFHMHFDGERAKWQSTPTRLLATIGISF